MGKIFVIGKNVPKVNSVNNFLGSLDGNSGNHLYYRLYNLLTYSYKKKYPIFWKIIMDEFEDVKIEKDEITGLITELHQVIDASKPKINHGSILSKLNLFGSSIELKLLPAERKFILDLIKLAEIARKSKFNLYALGD